MIKSSFLSERGQFSYGIIFMFMIMILIFMFWMVAPLLQAFVLGMYNGLEPVVDISRGYADDINDVDTRGAFVGAIDAQETAVVSGNQVLSALIGFGGVFVVVLVVVVFYLLSRRNVQAGYLG